MKQFVSPATLWTCFIGTWLEVSGKWRPKPRGSSLRPSFGLESKLHCRVGQVGRAGPRMEEGEGEEEVVVVVGGGS